MLAGRLFGRWVTGLASMAGRFSSYNSSTSSGLDPEAKLFSNLGNTFLDCFCISSGRLHFTDFFSCFLGYSIEANWESSLKMPMHSVLIAWPKQRWRISTSIASLKKNHKSCSSKNSLPLQEFWPMNSQRIQKMRWVSDSFATRYLASVAARAWRVWLASRALFANALTLGGAKNVWLGDLHMCQWSETSLRLKPSDRLFKLLFELLFGHGLPGVNRLQIAACKHTGMFGVNMHEEERNHSWNIQLSPLGFPQEGW